MPQAPSDVARLVDAIAFTADRHRNQRRKDADATPYINHPVALARVLTAEGGVTDLETILAAVLHDTIEDTETTRNELAEKFGEDVAAVVAEVTDDKSVKKTQRKEMQIEHAPHLSSRAKAVKLADKICNLRDVAGSPPATWPLARRQEYFDWAKRVVDGLRGEHSVFEGIFDDVYRLRPPDDGGAAVIDENKKQHEALAAAHALVGSAAELTPCGMPSPAPYGFEGRAADYLFFYVAPLDGRMNFGASDYVAYSKKTGTAELWTGIGE
jgi:GTP diphosphokinase / guanosine-3',5'-bis(diphosphate) 3'-diphosphatase